MRAIWVACTALMCAAETASAQKSSPDVGDPDSDAELKEFGVDLDAIAGETIEISSDAPIDTAAAPSEVVKREEVRTLPGARGDAVEAVRNLPGVAFAASFDGGGALAVRGTSGVDSSYLIDGISVPSAMHFGNFTAVLPVEMIESIELSPGGFDVAMGRATGGVVEIKTRAPRPEWNGAAEVSFVHASAFLQGALWKNEASFAVGIRRSFIDALLPAFLPDDADVSFSRAPRYADLQLRVDWTPSYRNTFTLLGLGSDDAVDFDVSIENPIDPVFTGNFDQRDRFWRGVATWHYEGDDIVSHASVGAGISYVAQHVNDSFYYELEPREVDLREDLGVNLTRWLKLRVGADVRALSTDIDARIPVFPGEGAQPINLTTAPTLDFRDRVRDIQSAAYLATDVRPFRALTVTPGIRVDHFSHVDDVVVQPRLSSQLAFGSGWTARAAVGRYTRPHALAEQLPDDLDAETAIHVTGGVERRFGESVRASLTLFATRLDDLVVADPTIMTGDLLDQYVNRGEGNVRGAELLVRIRSGDLSGHLAYTYSRSRRTDGPGMDERAFDYDQPHNLVAAASWGRGAWRFGGRFRLASGTPYTPVVGAVYLADQDFYQPLYAPPNSDRMEMSHQLDLRVDREFAFQSWKLSAYIDVSDVYANPRVWGYAYEFDYTKREAQTDLPLLPSIGVRGEF